MRKDDKPAANLAGEVCFAGAVIRVYASSVDRNAFVVDIDTTDLSERFEHAKDRIPNLRIYVNEELLKSEGDGTWAIQ